MTARAERGLSVIIPSKTASNIEPCVASIIANERPYPRIIVVDDGIKFTNIEQKMFVAGHTQMVPGVKPFVFARNVNIGIRMAESDDVIVMNDDALLKTPGGFKSMKIMADHNPEFGVVSAASNNVGNTNMHPRTTFALREDFRMVCFVCAFIPRMTINTVGLLDEQFIHYGMDDDDYCLRVRNLGMRIGIYDGCVVDHSSLKSTYRGDGGGDFSQNLDIFKKKWGVDNFGRRA